MSGAIFTLKRADFKCLFMYSSSGLSLVGSRFIHHQRWQNTNITSESWMKSSMGPHSHQTESQRWSIWSLWWMTEFILSTCSTAGLSQPAESAAHRDHGSHLCLGLLNATHRLSALLCLTSETVLWRFQFVFDPLLKAEWSFLFHNISRCFRTYHSAAIIRFFIDPLREFRFYFWPIS